MSYKHYTRGPIQLFALPGTEDYVKNIAQWLAKNFLKEISDKKSEIIEYLYMNKDEEEILEKYTGKLEDFLADFLIGNFTYYSHKNGAIEISINTSARCKDIYVFHTFSETDIIDNNGNPCHLNLADQEVLLYNTLDAFLESKANQVAVFEMNLGQARSDRPKGRGACNLRTFFRNLTANRADHFFIYQIHSSKSLIGLDNTRTTYDNLRGQSILKKYILHKYIKTMEYFKNVVQKEWLFSSVDAGGKEFAARFAKSLGTPLLVVDKRRNPETNLIEEISILQPETLSLNDKIIYIADDMIDSGKSIASVCRKYKEFGVKEINIIAFYGIFSPPAEEILNQLRKEGALNKIIVTDLISHNKDFLKRNPYIEIVDTTYTTSRIIMRTNMGSSLEKYFLPLNAEEYLKNKVEPLIVETSG
jgi:phosphoribosylpyrophosphate synthetase